jgi:hypothetical protein
MTQDAYDFDAGEGKFCKDCRHVRLNSAPGPACGHPDCEGPADPVTGQAVSPSCSAARAPGGKCGPEGGLFELRVDR